MFENRTVDYQYTRQGWRIYRRKAKRARREEQWLKYNGIELGRVFLEMTVARVEKWETVTGITRDRKSKQYISSGIDVNKDIRVF